MTTDPNPLQDRLWDAIFVARDLPGKTGEAPTESIVEAVLPIIDAEVRKGQADAWDEGFEVGEGNGYAIGRDIDTDENTENPYREQEN